MSELFLDLHSHGVQPGAGSGSVLNTSKPPSISIETPRFINEDADAQKTQGTMRVAPPPRKPGAYSSSETWFPNQLI